MELLILTGVLVLAIILALLSSLFVWWLVESFVLDAPFLPLPQPVVDRLVSKLPLAHDTTFYDLGCGDGRILTALATSNPTVRFFGVEKALIPSVWLRLKTKVGTKINKNLHFQRQDYRTVDLSRVDTVFMYLWPGAMTELERKCLEEMPPGSTVVVCRFPFPSLQPVQTERIDYQGQSYRFFYYQL